jgi:Spy/CpxP family protein refolding chaperone
MAAIQKDHRQQMQNLLTPEQKAQIEKMKTERKEMAQVNAKARAEKMKIKLGLSDQQAQQLKELHTSTAAKMKQIHSDQSLSPDQKKEQIKSLVQDQKQQLKTVLSPEQLKQLDEMHHGHQRNWTK